MRRLASPFGQSFIFTFQFTANYWIHIPLRQAKPVHITGAGDQATHESERTSAIRIPLPVPIRHWEQVPSGKIGYVVISKVVVDC